MKKNSKSVVLLLMEHFVFYWEHHSFFNQIRLHRTVQGGTMMIKKIFFSLSLISVLLFPWMGIGNALTLGYNFGGNFDSGIFSEQPFSGYFQYDTAQNSDLQNDFCSVTVGANTYPDAGSGIRSSFIPDNKIRIAGLSGLNPGDALWSTIASFNVTRISLDQPLPLGSFINSSFDFSIIGSWNSSGKLDNLGERSPVPEPATMLLLGSGLIGLAVIGRKRFKKVDNGLYITQ